MANPNILELESKIYAQEKIIAQLGASNEKYRTMMLSKDEEIRALKVKCGEIKSKKR